MCGSYVIIVNYENLVKLRNLYKDIYREASVYKIVCQTKIAKIHFLPLQSLSSSKENR